MTRQVERRREPWWAPIVASAAIAFGAALYNDLRKADEDARVSAARLDERVNGLAGQVHAIADRWRPLATAGDRQ